MSKNYKMNELFTRLYGREAYEAWKSREAEIDEMMRDRKRYSVACIVAMRERNFRQMKAAGELRGHVVGAAKVVPVAFGKVA